MEAQKKSARRACAAILAAAALWGVIGIWNRRLMAAGLLPTSIVTVRNCGGGAAGPGGRIFLCPVQHLRPVRPGPL